MSLTSITDEQVNDFTIAVNDNIQRGLADGTMTDDEANYLRRVLIHVQADPEHLNVLIGLIQGFKASCASSTASTSSTVSASLTANASSTTDASSTANSMEECNNITNFVNLNIQCGINVRITRDDEHRVKLLRDVLIRMRTDTTLLNAIINFRKSFMDLNACLVSINGTTSNAFLLQVVFRLQLFIRL